jgi:CHAT domain-containing protein
MANLLPELFESASTENAGGGLLVLGDIDYDNEARSQEFVSPSLPLLAKFRTRSEAAQLRSGRAWHWGALPGFREELDSIQGLFLQQHPQKSILVLSGNQATEAAFLAQAHEYRTLHLITHGYFEDPGVKSIHQTDVRPDALSSQVKSPATFINMYLPGLLSGLAMAGANKPSEDPEVPDDGILRASEIEASSLQGVDLVVLSACETGLGAVAGGEGLTGLQRAFQVAGARTVVASLWKVDDRATQELMTQFYSNLWVKKQSKVDALRNAQLYLLRNPVLSDGTRLTRGDINKAKPVVPDSTTSRDATDPFFWAAWTLSGDWR